MSISDSESRHSRGIASTHPIILAIVVVAALLRLSYLGSLPPPLNQDEASRLYDAWSLLETGKDRHGESWPLFLKSFGESDYTASLTTILTIPFVAIFGPAEWAVRLPDALCGVITVWLVFLVARQMLGDGSGIAAALVLALDPWHLSLCRTGHESGFAPVFLAGALLAIAQAGLLCQDESDIGVGKPAAMRHAVWAALGGALFGLHTWVYPATRFFTPLFLTAILAIYAPIWLRRRKTLGIVVVSAFGGLIASASPIWVAAIGHPERIAARAGVAIWWQANLDSHPVWMFLKNYAQNLSPAYYFLHFDEMSGMAIDGVGLHLLVTAPLFLAGLLVTIHRCRRSRWSRLLIAWFLLYPVPAAICVDWNPHPFRAVAGMALYPLIAATGWCWVASRLSVNARKRVALFGLPCLIINFGCFVFIYAGRMPKILEDGYQTGLVRAMQFVAERGEQADFVLVTRHFTQPYIYALVYGSIPPAELPSLPIISGKDLKGFHQVNRIGKFYFPPNRPEDTPELSEKFQRAFAALPPDAEGLVIELEGKFPGGRVIAAFPNGRAPNVEVRVWRPQEPPPATLRDTK